MQAKRLTASESQRMRTTTAMTLLLGLASLRQGWRWWHLLALVCVNHLDGWADGGGTDITKLTWACGPDNRKVEEQGWTTRKGKDGRTEWIPPPHLDTGQARVNDYHHPEKYLKPEETDP